MVELLIALALSSFLILGATQIYIDNKRNYLFQQGQAETMENGRFMLGMLDAQLSKAGYRRRADQAMEDVFPARGTEGAPAAVATTTSGGGSCTFGNGEALAVQSDDSLCVRYQPRDENDRDCAGNALSGVSGLDTPYTTASKYFVEKFEVTSDGGLRCSGQEMISSGVSDIRYQFGVSAVGDREVEAYVDSDNINDRTIRSLRYSILLASTAQNLRQGMDSKAYCDWQEMLDTSAECESPPDDRLYQVVTSTTTLRNLVP